MRDRSLHHLASLNQTLSSNISPSLSFEDYRQQTVVSRETLTSTPTEVSFKAHPQQQQLQQQQVHQKYYHSVITEHLCLSFHFSRRHKDLKILASLLTSLITQKAMNILIAINEIGMINILIFKFH